jgi:dihydroorotate dehydrogenase (NAD+) catalytic subunit
MVKLGFSIGDLKFKNPVLTASGTFGYGSEFDDFFDVSKLGGIILKGTTLEPREGNRYPRMAETPMGMLNAVGSAEQGHRLF